MLTFGEWNLQLSSHGFAVNEHNVCFCLFTFRLRSRESGMVILADKSRQGVNGSIRIDLEDAFKIGLLKKNMRSPCLDENTCKSQPAITAMVTSIHSKEL